MCAELEASRQRLKAETERRLAALDELRHAERLATVGRLASGIAHELGTPLNVVGARAKIIMSERLARSEMADNGRIILEQAERISRLVQQLLNYARKRQLQSEAAEVTTLAAEALELLRPVADGAGVELELIDEAEGARPEVDRVLLQQVFLNLAMNAIQAMPAGGRLQVQLRRCAPPNRDGAGESLAVTFRDQGEGIPEADKHRLFEPFFTTRQSGEGTGLGLSICQGIVEDHGGWIDVQSETGRGSTFTIYLPLPTATG
jgi:signal transduction histidine kinase